MTDHNADRRGELIAAALVGELTTAEAAELERMRESDPTIDAELAELHGIAGHIAGLPEWVDATPSEALRDRVLALEPGSGLGLETADGDASEGGAGEGDVSEGDASEGDASEDGLSEDGLSEGGLSEDGLSEGGLAEGDVSRESPTESRAHGGTRGESKLSAAGDARAESPGVAPVTPLRRPRIRAGLLVGVAAAGLVVGVGAGLFLPRPEATPPVGDPGTLGAVEPVDFRGEPSGVEIDGSVVAHTWGTETLLTVNGLPSGEFYSVVVVDADGQDVGSGTFLGSEVEINCAVNAAALREEVTSVEIRGTGGDVVASAELPRVDG